MGSGMTHSSPFRARIRRGPPLAFRLLAVLCAALIFGCNDAPIRPMNHTVALTGQYCTNDSTTFGVPIRILLIVDTSKSMEINDPAGARGRAASQLVSHFLDTGKDVSFAFMEFNTAARELTQGFTKDRAVLDSAVAGLNNIEGFTNYLGALGLARTVINADISKTAEELRAMEQRGENTRYARPWYFVVFLSDGIPKMQGGTIQSTDSILFEAEQMMAVPPDVTGITLHTAFLGAQDDELRPEAEVLLKKMAHTGHGAYFSFTSSDEIDFSVFDFEIKRLFDIKNVLVYNRHSVLEDDAEVPLADSDADGLSDEKEDALGTDPLKRDTDGDGLSDGFETRVALKPLVFNNVCNSDALQDSDSDGLNDCEETFLNLKKDRFDSDGDLFPDHFEVIGGANAGDPTDGESDLDFDGVTAADELRLGTKVNGFDADDHPRYGHTFTVARAFNDEKGSLCYEFNVANVGLVNTRATAEHEAGVNELVIEFTESPEDQPDRLFSLYRLVLPVNYTDHRRGQLNTEGHDFSLITTMELPLRQ